MHPVCFVFVLSFYYKCLSNTCCVLGSILSSLSSNTMIKNIDNYLDDIRCIFFWGKVRDKQINNLPNKIISDDKCHEEIKIK